MRWLVTLAAALSAVSCVPRVTAPPPKLALADSAWDLEPCKSNDMLRHLFRAPAHTWPVPLAGTRGLEFKILFYPLTWAYGEKAPMYGPVASAVIDLEAGAVISCAYTTTSPKGLSGAPPPRTTERAYKLYELTEKVALVYAGEKPVTSREKALAKDYLALFESLAEPPLRSDYEAVNPGFWLWLRRAALK